MAKDVEKVPASETALVASGNGGMMTPHEFGHAMKTKTLEVTVSDDEIQAQMMERIASAPSIEAMLKEVEVLKAKDILGKSIVVNDFHLNNSDIENSPGVYGVLDVTINGKAETVICGGEKVMMQLYTAKYNGWLPAPLRIMESEKTSASGFRWLYLELDQDSEEPF